jgi:putative heme transporter
MSFRAWLSVVTVALIAVILFLSRHELVRAWELLGQVNLWILLLLLPLQILVYYASAEMIFSYLRAKGQMKRANRAELIRIAFEGNFVNHILPSGGVSGVSYLTWRLGHLGVTPGRAAMAQVVKHAASFIAYAIILLIALFAVTVDGELNRWIILTSAGLFGAIVTVVLLAIYLFSSKRRIDIFGDWAYKFINLCVRKVTFGRKRKLIKQEVLEEFLEDMHRDYLELRHDKNLLRKPLLWGVVFTLADAGLFMVTFLALGELFNPAPILIAYGLASAVGFFVLTPGGAGAYEAIMVTFLAFAGIAGGVAIAGILLTRIVLLIGTIGLGYFFYQHALSKYGKVKHEPKIKR